MSNTLLTHQMIAREAAAMLVEDANLIKNINTGRSDEFGQNVQGYQKGDFVDIGVPNVPTVYDGSQFAGGGSAPDWTEQKVRLQLNKQKHVPVAFTAKEKKLSLTDFKARILKPAMQSLASIVQADLLSDFVASVPNVVGTWGTVPSTRTPYAQARAKLENFLAPTGQRTILFSSDANVGLAEANATLFHDSKEIKSAFDDGAVGRYAGFDFYENQSLPVIANGAGAGYLVNGAGQSGSSLVVDTGTGAMPRGTVFTIAGVNAIHPITGASLGYLRQFVVTADYAGGGGSVAIYPAITPHSASVVGTVDAAPADNAAITIFGTASQSKRQNLAFHRDAFAAAFVPLPVLASCEGYTATVQGISVRVMTFGDGLNDIERTRIDVLYGNATVRNDHACRITE
jgi:hypothetical protein